MNVFNLQTSKSCTKEVGEQIVQVTAIEIVKDEEKDTFTEVITQVTESIIEDEGSKVVTTVTKEIKEEVTETNEKVEAEAELEMVSEDAISENSL